MKKKKKKKYSLQFAIYTFFELPEKPPHASAKTCSAIWEFCEIDVFPLGVFSIFNFNLRNLKGNGIEAIDEGGD